MCLITEILNEVHQEVLKPQPIIETDERLPGKKHKSRLPERIMHGKTVRHGTPGNKNLDRQKKPSWLIDQRDKMLVMLDQLIRTGKCSITQYDYDTSHWYRALNDLVHMICHNGWLFKHKQTHDLIARWKTEVHNQLGDHRTMNASVHWSHASKMNMVSVQKLGIQSLDYYADSIPLSIRILEITALGYGVEEPQEIVKYAAK